MLKRLSLIIIGTLAIAAAVAACGGSENCDEAVERCRTDCPDGSVLQTECIAAFEVSTETACEAALMNFVCTSTVP